MLRWFESNPAQNYRNFIFNCYNPVILLSIKTVAEIARVIKKITKALNLGSLNKFLIGVIMIKIKPITLLKKNLG